MKKTLTFLVAIIGCTFFTISATAVSAQSTVSASTTDMVPTADFPHGNGGDTWKSPVDYAAIIATEHANTVLVLATPGLKEAKIALYTGYDKMLGYMQTDLAANVPVANIAPDNFKRISLEIPGDPILKNMQADEFSALYATLVEKLLPQ